MLLQLALSKTGFLIGFSFYEFKKILRRAAFNVTDDRQETQLALE